MSEKLVKTRHRPGASGHVDMLEVVSGVLAAYKAQDPSDYQCGAPLANHPTMQGNWLKSAATLHAASLQALAVVEAAQIQADAIDRLAAAIRAAGPEHKRCRCSQG